MRSKSPAKLAKRRTTLTLPADTLLQAEQIARQRKVSLSSVVADALAAALMTDPASGPFLFETSVESWLMRERLDTRCFGAALPKSGVAPSRQCAAATSGNLGRVFALDSSTAVAAGEIMALIPQPPTSPRRSHGIAVSHPDRLRRWRFDAMIAATALVARLPLVHNNPADFEAIRSAIERSPARFPGLGPLELLRCAALA